MRTVFPDYYDQFRCIAGSCRHSCCVGWEIDVDEQSLERYKAVPGELGKKLRVNIDTSDCPHFKLGAGERCPFLNEQNLCELILELGEDSLCQICSDHPRFRNEFSGRTEIGLGLCCEAAAALILGHSDPVQLASVSDGSPSTELDDREIEVLEARDDAFAIMQDRSRTMAERAQRLLAEFEIRLPEITYSEWADFFLSLERLDPAWTAYLEQLRSWQPQQSLSLAPELEIPFEQLSVYFLYRHIPSAQDVPDLKARIGFAVLGCRILAALCCICHQNGKDALSLLPELARLYSSEIEYSEENTNAILDLLWDENAF